MLADVKYGISNYYSFIWIILTSFYIVINTDFQSHFNQSKIFSQARKEFLFKPLCNNIMIVTLLKTDYYSFHCNCFLA